jgi:hypothetical protein
MRTAVMGLSLCGHVRLADDAGNIERTVGARMNRRLLFTFIHSVVQTFAGVIHYQPLALAAVFDQFP